MRSLMTGLSRRAFLVLVALVAPAARLQAWTRQPATAPAITLDEFIELSQRLLGRSRLDREVAQTYLTALSADADTAIYLATLSQSNGNPTPEQSVVARTIIEWWYTGIYTINGKSRVATHTGALTWSALGMPAPGTCTGAFGAWSRPPDTIA
jgi:hypothetical protein